MTPTSGSRGLQLIPLHDLQAVLLGEDNVVQVVGNLLAFAALGFLLPIRFRLADAMWVPGVVALVVASLSLLFEVLQFTLRLGRVASVDDILLNTVGAVLAALASARWWRSRADTGHQEERLDLWPAHQRRRLLRRAVTRYLIERRVLDGRRTGSGAVLRRGTCGERSSWGDDHFAERPPLTDVGERLRHLVEREGAIDVDAKLAGDTSLSDRLEVPRPLPRNQDPKSASGEEAEGRPDGHDPQQRSHGSANAEVAAASSQRPSVGEHRSVRDEIEHEVIRS